MSKLCLPTITFAAFALLTGGCVGDFESSVEGEPLLINNDDGADAGGGQTSGGGGGGGGGEDAGGGGGEDGGSGGGGDAGDAGGGEERPVAPEVDPNCIDGTFSEALPDPQADISAEVAAFDPAQPLDFAYAYLDKRWPVGGWLIRGGLTFTQMNCVQRFMGSPATPEQTIGRLMVTIHECGHAYNFTLGAGGGYHVNPDTTIRCSGGADVARSRLLDDDYNHLRPKCNLGVGNNCDRYAYVYLDGDPDDNVFDGGDQGFDMVLEETLQYINSLATSYSYHPSISGSTSAFDGILTFLWYVERYLRMTRLDYPEEYAKLVDDPCWRDAILTVWGRAWLFIGAAEGIDALGIDEEVLFELVRDPDLLDEIQRIRDAEGCGG